VDTDTTGFTEPTGPADADRMDATSGGGAAAAQGLPSSRLARLAELTAADLRDASGDLGAAAPQVPPVLNEQALADVLAAVDASTAANTKAAYSSDWRRFTAWAGERGHPVLPADPGGGALRHGGGRGAGVGGSMAILAGDGDPVGVLDQPVPHRRGPAGAGEVGGVRRALSGVRRIRATPTCSPVAAAARGHPNPARPLG
jgi:hypothetical protein